MMTPKKAIVIPSVRNSTTGHKRLLDGVVAPMLKPGVRGSVAIQGGPGSGKTTALRHIAAMIPEGLHVEFIDDAQSRPSRGLSSHSLVFYSSSVGCFKSNDDDLARLRLAPWTQDEWIEYLLARHKPQCASVMDRLNRCPDIAELAGAPLLTRIVLDAFANDQTIDTVRSALVRFLDGELCNTRQREDARAHALAAMFCDHVSDFPDKPLLRLMSSACQPRVIQSLRHDVTRRLLATERVLLDLNSRRPPTYLAQGFDHACIESIGDAIAPNSRCLRRLTSILADPKQARSHATTASLLNASRTGWLPDDDSRPDLAGAWLPGAHWARLRMPHARLDRADLSGADLSDAVLEAAQASHALFLNANLHGALLHGIDFRGAEFGSADLSFVRANYASFSECEMTGVSLEGALLQDADFSLAQLTDASFVRANLSGARFSHARIANADFSSACLDNAILHDHDLTEARLVGAMFRSAQLRRCNLEYQEMPDADFRAADLSGALLTGSVMPRASFSGADLSRTGLADVEWENADLTNADLRQASFHAGSSRSGLVGSPLASEGSRTGFYTDEFDEQNFLAPEEIRKANLRGADLRGAKIMDTDFYLVDLRDAIYDDEQADHLRRCRAILESRV